MRRLVSLVLGVALVGGVGPATALGRTVETSTVHLSEIVVSGWNHLQFGYTVGGKSVVLIDKAYQASYEGDTALDVRVPTSALGTFELFMKDVTCHAMYREDGSGAANHAYSGTVIDGAHRVSFADGGATCEYRRVDRVPGEYNGNAQAVVTK